MGGDEYEVTIGYRYIVHTTGRPALAKLKYWPPFQMRARYAAQKVSKIGLGTCEVKLAIKSSSLSDAFCGHVFAARRDRVHLDAYGQPIWEPL